jgi:hypothetical protein
MDSRSNLSIPLFVNITVSNQISPHFRITKQLLRGKYTKDILDRIPEKYTIIIHVLSVKRIKSAWSHDERKRKRPLNNMIASKCYSIVWFL